MSGVRRAAPPDPPAFEPRIEAYGESAVLVALGDAADIAVNRRVHRLAEAIGSLRASTARTEPPSDPRRPPPIGRPVAGFASMLVPFDSEAIDGDAVRSLLEPLLAGLFEGPEPAAPTDEPLTIPVRYGGDDGPDLAELADRHGLRSSDVIELHATTMYEVLFLGFAPGFGYLGFVPDGIATPRRPTPRPRVPAGSVGIAGNQTCVYPFATPGGWNLIGRTAVRMWDLARREPALLAPGRRVRFAPEL